MTHFVDTHCHLNHPEFDGDREDVLGRAEAAGVTRLLCIGYDCASSSRAAELTADARIYAAVGIHPEAAHEWSEETADELAALYHSSPGKVVAYGEIGLDYHWDTVPHETQQRAFEAQVAFAQTLRSDLPLIIHNREALTDVLSLLQALGTAAPVVMHCFTGDVNEARDILDAGHWLGIGGVATFKKSDAVREAIAYAPLERLLLETDCPYLAPQFKRGRRNEPSYLPAVAETVATVKGMTIDEVAAGTTANARALFGLPPSPQ